MEVRSYLEQLDKQDRLIENKLLEKQRWKEIAMSITVSTEGEKVQSSGSQQKMENAIINYIDLEREIDMDIIRCAKEKQKIINTLELLPAIEYDVLHMIYVQHKTFDDIADKYTKSYSWSTTIHGRALQHLQEILDNRK